MRALADSDLKVLPYDKRAAEWHALARARLQRAGATPPSADAQIAAVAVVNNLVLVTHNIRDFRRFEGLSLVDWTRNA